jgi:hypothetical protein
MEERQMNLARLAATVALVAAAPTIARAQANNDGVWAVSINTLKGACDSSMQSNVHVRGGRIEEDYLFAHISGAIDDFGKVSLSVVRGDDGIVARGRVNGEHASGKWASRHCLGSWTATRS